MWGLVRTSALVANTPVILCSDDQIRASLPAWANPVGASLNTLIDPKHLQAAINTCTSGLISSGAKVLDPSRIMVQIADQSSGRARFAKLISRVIFENADFLQAELQRALFVLHQAASSRKYAIQSVYRTAL